MSGFSSNNTQSGNLPVTHNQQALADLASPFANTPIGSQATAKVDVQENVQEAGSPFVPQQGTSYPMHQPMQQQGYAPQQPAHPAVQQNMPQMQQPVNNTQVNYQNQTPTQQTSFNQQLPANYQQQVNFDSQQNRQQPAGNTVDVTQLITQSLFDYSVQPQQQVPDNGQQQPVQTEGQQQGVQNFEAQPATIAVPKWLEENATKEQFFDLYDNNPQAVMQEFAGYINQQAQQLVNEQLQPLLEHVDNLTQTLEAYEENDRLNSIAQIKDRVLTQLRSEGLNIPVALQQAVYSNLAPHVDEKYVDYSRLYDGLASKGQIHILQNMNLVNQNGSKLTLEDFITVSAVREAKELYRQLGQPQANQQNRPSYSTHPAMPAQANAAAGAVGAADIRNMSTAERRQWANQNRVRR